MTTIEYLRQIGRYDRLINNKMVEIQQYRDMICRLKGVTYEERVQSTPISFDKIGDSVAKLNELETECDKLIDVFVDAKRKIISQLEQIQNEDYYEILFARYIEKKTFEEIACVIKYSYRQTRRLHVKALNKFEEMFGAEY